MGDICINYSIYKDTNELAVNCGTRTLFFEHIPNRKGYLEYLLDRFFFAHQFLEYKMQQLYEEESPRALKEKELESVNGGGGGGGNRKKRKYEG